MTPRERRLLEKKRKAAGKKTLVDKARNLVQSTNRNVYNTLIKSKPTKGRAVRGKTKRSAPKAPTLPKSQAMLEAEKKAAALKKKAAAESAASKRRLAAIKAGKNPEFPTTTTKPAAKKTPRVTDKSATAKKAPAAPSLKKFNAGKATTPERGRVFAEPPMAKAPKAPTLPSAPKAKAKAKPAPKAKAKAPTKAKPASKPSTASTASTYKAHGSDLHVGRYKTLAEHRAAVAARKKKEKKNG